MKNAINSRSAVALLYHEQTKHHFQRYARSAGSLDWANQPNPFRFYDGVDTVQLPLLAADPVGGHRALYERDGNLFQGVSRSTIGAFLELALGLSAWKSVPGSTWALRMNPSSGNLHPTEAHLILPVLPGVPAGVFHYNSYLHALEKRAAVPDRLGLQIQTHLQAEGFLIALTSIFWREAWKYGERAFRYWSWWLVVFVAVWAGFYFYFAPEPVALFQKNWIFILVGVIGAFLGNISAVGGASFSSR